MAGYALPCSLWWSGWHSSSGWRWSSGRCPSYARRPTPTGLSETCRRRARGGRVPPGRGGGPRPPSAARRKLIAIAQGVLLVVAIGAAAYLSSADQWKPLALVGLIALLVLGSDILVLDAKRFRISGSFTGLALAMALLGPAPAAALGLTSAIIDGTRRHVRGTYLL